jgi:hypothetical protein
VCFGIVGALCQLAALTKLADDASKAEKGAMGDAWARLASGTLSLTITTADVIMNTYKGSVLLKYGPGHPTLGIDRVMKVSKGLGVAAAVVVAFADLYQAYGAYKEKQLGMTVLYLGAAVTGVGLAVALAYPAMLGAAAVPVIGLLIVAVIGISILIEYFKDNKMQDWLERCYWGVLPGERYNNERYEQAAFHAAIKGD